MIIHGVLRPVLTGMLLGAALALTVPAQGTTASSRCRCDDWSTGSYQCNAGQTNCEAGSQVCRVECVDQV